MRDFSLCLKDIINAKVAIENFVKGMDFDEFKNNGLVSSVVIKKFEIIREAAKNISEEVREKYPAISWKRMAGMRDRLIHFYFGVKYELVWETIQKELPKLKSSIREILKEFQGNSV